MSPITPVRPRPSRRRVLAVIGVLVALASGCNLRSAGSNLAGQLGDGTAEPRPAPVAVVGGLTFVTVDAGLAHTCGITTDGALHCWGEGDDAYWSHPPQTAQYRAEVTDLLRRFHPVSFAVQLPFRGLFLPACAAQSPPGPAGGVELFSTASRPLPGALAVVRAELSSVVLGSPAAWALLTAEYRGAVLGRGVADRQGRVVLAFPFPEPERRPRPIWSVRVQTPPAISPRPRTHSVSFRAPPEIWSST